MAKYKGTKVQTLKGDLMYVFITGEGRNNAQKNQPPRMQFVASIRTKKDSAVHKDMQAKIDAEWEQYKTKFGAKGLPKSNGIKDVMIPDPKGTIDPKTEEVAKIPSGDVLITFKTDTKWPDGNPHIVKVYANQKDANGKVYAADITDVINSAQWYIGEGSTGIVHGVAQGNDTGGDHKVTLYLSAIQLAHLEKYEGDAPELVEIDDEVIDLGLEIDDTSEPLSEDEQPNI